MNFHVPCLVTLLTIIEISYAQQQQQQQQQSRQYQYINSRQPTPAYYDQQAYYNQQQANSLNGQQRIPSQEKRERPLQRPTQALPAQVFEQPNPAKNDIGNRLLIEDTKLQAGITPELSQSHLATKFLAEISEGMGADTNVVISPFSIWAVSLMLLEAADGKTSQELSALLEIANTPGTASSAYSTLFRGINAGNRRNNQGGFVSHNFLVRDQKIQPTAAFTKHAKEDFQAKDFPINPQSAAKSAADVNNWVSSVTKSKIRTVLKPEDFNDLKLLLGNVAYFKGHWKQTFNKSATFTDEFKDSRDVVLGQLKMMVEKQILSYGYSPAYESQIVEIPYVDGKTSMIVVLPKRNVPLQKVLSQLKGKSLTDVLPEMSEEEVELYLPRFKLSLDLTLNVIYVRLGVQDVFNDGSASLPGISNMAFVSKINHLAEIENDEEGTTSAAVTSAHVSYKTSSVTFHANRPFIYFVNDIKTRAILFAGTFSNPNTVDS